MRHYVLYLKRLLAELASNLVSMKDLKCHLGRLLKQSIVVFALLALSVLTGGGCLVLLVDAVGTE